MAGVDFAFNFFETRWKQIVRGGTTWTTFILGRVAGTRILTTALAGKDSFRCQKISQACAAVFSGKLGARMVLRLPALAPSMTGSPRTEASATPHPYTAGVGEI